MGLAATADGQDCEKKRVAADLDVRHAVVVEIGGGGEAFAADGTLVRLLSAVDPPVRVQRAGRREAFTAHVAHVRFLTCGNCKPKMF